MSNNRFANPEPSDLKHDRPLLSEREEEVINKEGSYEKIAEQMDIGKSTVGTYKNRAKSKLDQQVDIIKIMLRQQYQDNRKKDVKEIAEESVETLKDLGIDAELKIED